MLIIFDIDGTVCDTQEVEGRCFAEAFEEVCGRSLKTLDWTQYSEPTSSGIAQALLRGESDLAFKERPHPRLARLRRERRHRWEQSELAKYEAKSKKPPKNWQERYKEPEPLTESEIAALPPIPDGWLWTRLYSLVEDGNIFDGPFGTKLKTKDYTLDGTRVIRLENIAPLRFVAGKKSFVSEEKFRELKNHEVFPGDVFFSSFIFEPLRVCVLPELPTTAIAKADCLCVRSTFPGILNQYLCFALASPVTGFLVADDVHGATRPRINTSQLRAVPVAIPPTAEQTEIVRRVEDFWDAVASLEDAAAQSSKDLTALTQSLLAKAFRGELVQQDPSDEPASALLARLREQREATKPKKKSKTKRACGSR